MVRGANLALKFLVELAAVAALAYWGTTIDGGATGVLIAIAVAATMIALWGRFAAPRSEHRLPTPSRVLLELLRNELDSLDPSEWALIPRSTDAVVRFPGDACLPRKQA